MDDTLHVKGLSDLGAALDAMHTKMRDNIMRAALRAGCKVIQTQAKAICPQESSGTYSKYKQTLGWTPGALLKSIRIGAKLKDGMVTATVKAGDKKAYYAHMVEFGTAAHWIRPKNGKSLFIAGMFKEAIHHPGARKNPFMRVALDRQAQASVERVGEYIRGRLTKEGIEIPDSETAGTE